MPGESTTCDPVDLVWHVNDAWSRRDLQLDTVRVYGNAVLARIAFSGRGRTSGVEISERIFEVF